MNERKQATRQPPSAQHGPQILATSAGRGWDGLEAEFVRVPRGKARGPGGDRHVLGMHFGRPVNADCLVGDRRRRGLQGHGDMDFIPADTPGSWEDDAECHVLRVSLERSLLDRVAVDLDLAPAAAELVPRLQIRDARMEALLHAVKADLEASVPSDPLYVGHLAHALAIRLIETAGDGRRDVGRLRAIESRQLVHIVDYIRANLVRRLSLDELARVAGLSPTRLKIAFRNGTGMPVHQYVIRCRLEHARDLITTTTMPASEIALAAGFAHQSHMGTTMRRLLGHTPGELPRPARILGPIPQKIGPNVGEGPGIDP